MTVLLVFSSLVSARAADDETFKLEFEASYLQAEVRSMLEAVNELRTGEDAWYWNEDNSAKVTVSGLKPLNYDYGLEKIAMLRCREIVAYYSHTRPDGTRCFTAYTSTYSRSMGENIAYGYTSAQSMFIGWAEEDEPYEYQGHRRNMLSENFTSIGIACVEYGGRKYWVQEFSNVTADTNPVEYSTDPQTMRITALKRLISLKAQFANSYYENDGTLQMSEGERIEMPVISSTVSLGTARFPVNASVTAVSKDESIVKIEDNCLVAVSGGTAEIVFTVEYQGVQIEKDLKVTVTGHEHDYELDHWEWAADYSSAEAVFICSSDSSHIYHAAAEISSERTEPTCTKEGSIVYTAAVTISGKEYTDSKTQDIPALEHDWGEIEYSWSEDYKTCTASVTCRTGGEKDEETVKTTYEVITEPGPETEGLGRYTAAFTNTRFYTQIKEVVIPALEHEHDYQFDRMEWSADSSSAAAVFICTKNPEHELRIEAIVTHGFTAPTCKYDGNYWYNASAEYEGNTYIAVKGGKFDALPQYWEEPAYTWESDNSRVTAFTACQIEPEEIETETVETVYQVIKVPTGTESGTGRYTAEFESDVFTTQTKDVEIAKILPQKINMVQGNIEMKTLSTYQLNATITPAEADQTVIYSVVNKDIAEVSPTGLITAKQFGFTSVTATSKADPSKSVSALICSRYYDVFDKNLYYYNAVYWAAVQEITKGYGNVYFGPKNKCTREAVVTFLWRAAGCPEPRTAKNPFRDVSSSKYYYKAVLWAAENGITRGYSDGTFRPDATCLREHVVTFLWRYEGEPSVNVRNPFNDIKSSDYYYKAALWANANGIAKGYSTGQYKGGFGPKLDCLREHVVTFLYRDKVKQ